MALSFLTLPQVVEAASRKDLPPTSPTKQGKVVVENLKKNIQQFASDTDAFTENAALLQVKEQNDRLMVSCVGPKVLKSGIKQTREIELTCECKIWMKIMSVR